MYRTCALGYCVLFFFWEGWQLAASRRVIVDLVSFFNKQFIPAPFGRPSNLGQVVHQLLLDCLGIPEQLCSSDSAPAKKYQRYLFELVPFRCLVLLKFLANANRGR